MSQKWEGVIGIGEEASYGGGVAATEFIAAVRANANPERVSPEDTRATGERPIFLSVMTGLDFAFDWEQWGEPRNLGRLLKFAIGSVDTTTPGGFAGDERRHTFSHGTTLPSFSLSIDRAIGGTPTKRYVGSKVNTLTLENVARDILMVTVEGAAQQEGNQAALSPTLSEFEYDPFMFHQLSVEIGLNGAAPAQDLTIERVQCVINNDLITDKVVANSSFYIVDLPVGRLRLSGEFDKEFANLNEYNVFVGNQQLDVKYIWSGDTMVGQPYRLEIDIPNCKITSLPLPEVAGASERGIYTVAFMGLYYSTDSRALNVVLDNDITSYAA